MKLLLIIVFSLAVNFSFAQNTVVVELFTSQGCSSCPAADKNLADIIEKAEANGQQVIGLSFHVDYWNYIGWKDPYSKAEYTERQKKYAAHLNPESVYTPQMIVNGESEFVGSNKTISNTEIAKALQKKNAFRITLGEIKQVNNKIAVSYSLDMNPTGEKINIALVEKNVGNEVTRGENSGRHLSHCNVVRSFQSLNAQKSGIIELDLPNGLKNGVLILFLQDKAWKVTGATSKIF